jgi:hypothetical protein
MWLHRLGWLHGKVILDSYKGCTMYDSKLHTKFDFMNLFLYNDKESVLLQNQAICFNKNTFNKLVHAFEDCRSRLNLRSS